MGSAYVYVQIWAYVYVRIYIMGSAYVYVQIYYGHMYTCGQILIFLMLLRLAYHLLLDSTKPHLPGITATTATTTFLFYTSSSSSSGDRETPLCFAIPPHIRTIIKDQTLLWQTPTQES